MIEALVLSFIVNIGALGWSTDACRASHAQTTGGVITEREFQLWIDWLERDGQLKRRPPPREFFDNELNPFAITTPRGDSQP